ncbi:MAG: hypothetical protein IPM92_00930 [Saprospiraceae bacterium]|nr:hypothetical protein [Saprospiraceae bacterium]
MFFRRNSAKARVTSPPAPLHEAERRAVLGSNEIFILINFHFLDFYAKSAGFVMSTRFVTPKSLHHRRTSKKQWSIAKSQ